MDPVVTEMEDVIYSPSNPTPNTPPNPTPNIIPKTIPNTTPIELKSPKKESDDEPLTNKKKPTRKSDIWYHYTKVKDDDKNNPRCNCNYCGADYACHSTRVGTSSLWVHFRKCKKRVDKKQKILSFKKETDGGSNLLAVTFNKVRCRTALAKFVVKDEQAFRVVEGDGFKELLQELQPKFVVPSRVTTVSAPNKRRLLQNYMHQQQMGISEKKNDLDRYLNEEPLNPMNSSFDILMWWKDNSERYKILSLIARDILAIPVSTVASEFAFSTSGRILDPFRSSLSPKMIEVLVCTQSWLKRDKGGVKLYDFMDETYSYQFVEEGDANKMKDQMATEKIATKDINIIDV